MAPSSYNGGASNLTYRRVLAIDPAVHKTGWAILDADGRRVTKIIKSGILEHATPTNIDDFAAKMSEPSVAPNIVVIEAQYLGKNVSTLIKLVEIRTRFQHSFEVRKTPVVIVSADEWQIGLLNGLIDRKSPREQRKKAALTYVQRLYDPTIKSQDIADAICIGIWAVRTDQINASKKPKLVFPTARVLRVIKPCLSS